MSWATPMEPPLTGGRIQSGACWDNTVFRHFPSRRFTTQVFDQSPRCTALVGRAWQGHPGQNSGRDHALRTTVSEPTLFE